MTSLRELLRGFFMRGSAPTPSAEPARAIPVAAVGDAGLDLVPLLVAAGFGDAQGWASRLADPMRQRGIAGPRRVAAFLATIGHESNGGRALEENLSYSADRVMAVWPGRFPTRESAAAVARNPRALAEVVYMHRLGNAVPGDGWSFRGRGLIQLTGRANYSMAADATGLPLLASPDIAAEPDTAAVIAAWWWADRRCNDLADAGVVEAWRRRVNGGLTGIEDVRRRYADVLSAMGAG